MRKALVKYGHKKITNDFSREREKRANLKYGPTKSQVGDEILNAIAVWNVVAHKNKYDFSMNITNDKSRIEAIDAKSRHWGSECK